MNRRMLLAGMASAIVGFIVGWVLLGMALARYFEGETLQYHGMLRPEAAVNLIGMCVAVIIFGLLMAWLGYRLKITSFFKGFLNGSAIGFLMYASIDLFLFSMMNVFAADSFPFLDLLANALWAAGLGAVAGWILAERKRAQRRYLVLQ